jgi:hypothetical protein
MKPLFTVHAGEFLVASYIEQRFKDYLVWIPSRDSGVDLLLTDKNCRKAVSIQVKFSRDFLMTHMADALRPGLKACGWFTLKRQKLLQSTANFWIFVLYPFNQKEVDFVIASPSSILDRLTSLHGKRKTIQSYIWVTFIRLHRRTIVRLTLPSARIELLNLANALVTLYTGFSNCLTRQKEIEHRQFSTRTKKSGVYKPSCLARTEAMRSNRIMQGNSVTRASIPGSI